MIKFIFVLNSDGNLVYGMTPNEVESYISKKTNGSKTLFAPETHSNAAQELERAETIIRSHAGNNSSLWVLGNGELLRRTLDAADYLYITQLDMFDNAEEEFTRFCDDFVEVKKSKICRSKDGISYQHQVWMNKKLLTTAKLD